MKTEYEHNIQISKEQTGTDGLLKLSELFLLFQDIAGAHADQLGCGYYDLLPRDLFFAITHSRVSIHRLPAAGEKLILRTCIGKVSHLFCPRYYMLYTEEEELLAEAAVRWVLMDTKKRCAVNPADADVSISGERNPWKLTEAAAVRPQEITEAADFTVTGDYLDVNGHMNNTRYFDMAEELIGEPLKGVHYTLAAAEYRSELLEGQTMKVSWGITADPEDPARSTCYLEGNTADRSIFRMKLEYRK